jgi:exodeoxyribonuclease VII small subunit
MAAKKEADNGAMLEKNMESLEKVISRLENDELNLNEAFDLYKEGMELLKKCNNSIDKIETELKTLEEEGI